MTSARQEKVAKNTDPHEEVNADGNRDRKSVDSGVGVRSRRNTKAGVSNG